MLDCSKKSYPSQWAAERALQAIQESCLSATWSKGPDGVLLVRPLQGLAPDLEVEESSSELGRKEAISRPRGIGKAVAAESSDSLAARLAA